MVKRCQKQILHPVLYSSTLEAGGYPYKDKEASNVDIPTDLL